MTQPYIIAYSIVATKAYMLHTKVSFIPTTLHLHNSLSFTLNVILLLTSSHLWYFVVTSAILIHKQLMSYPTYCTELAFNASRPRQNGRHSADDILKFIFVNENVWIPIKISLKFYSNGPVNNMPALVQIMAWCLPGTKPLSEPMMVSLLTPICDTRPQWVNRLGKRLSQLMKNLWDLMASGAIRNARGLRAGVVSVED